MNRILREDIDTFSLPDNLKEALSGSVVMVTGATGLIGSMFVRCVNALNIGVTFILPIRDLKKAEVLFEGISDSVINLIPLDSEIINNGNLKCDYIVHCASPTNGSYMSAHPVETFNTSVDYTKHLLEYSLKCKIKGMVYLSSIEYYGQIFDNEPVTEDMMGFIDHCSSRNSYALGKQAAEYLVFAYAKEYGVPVKTARLTQTFGAGISPTDNRVFAQFARSVVKGETIVLHTNGQSAKPYCYLTDCIAALVYILIMGDSGEAYNVATPNTFVSIRELANIFGRFSNLDNAIKSDLSSQHGYAPETRVNLDSTKLQRLGWKPKHSLDEMVERLIEFVKTSDNV